LRLNTHSYRNTRAWRHANALIVEELKKSIVTGDL
jgi:hypothetical protein